MNIHFSTEQLARRGKTLAMASWELLARRRRSLVGRAMTSTR